ncbi:MAG: hypothetical protein ABI298_06475 [Acidimicrobiales bacterium]
MEHRGTVTEFDDDRGLGVLRSDEGAYFSFHCVSIVDGSRTIAVGSRVRGERHVGLLGHDDVVDIESAN